LGVGLVLEHFESHLCFSLVVWLLFFIFIRGLRNPGLTCLAVLLIHGMPRPMSGSFADSTFFTGGGSSLVTRHTDKLIKFLYFCSRISEDSFVACSCVDFLLV
jgi:hypothetical protein